MCYPLKTRGAPITWAALIWRARSSTAPWLTWTVAFNIEMINKAQRQILWKTPGGGNPTSATGTTARCLGEIKKDVSDNLKPVTFWKPLSRSHLCQTFSLDWHWQRKVFEEELVYCFGLQMWTGIFVHSVRSEEPGWASSCIVFTGAWECYNMTGWEQRNGRKILQYRVICFQKTTVLIGVISTRNTAPATGSLLRCRELYIADSTSVKSMGFMRRC